MMLSAKGLITLDTYSDLPLFPSPCAFCAIRLPKVAQQRFVVKNELPHLAETEHFQHLRLALFERLARAELRDRLVERLFRRLTRDAEPLLDPFVWHDPEVCAPGLFQRSEEHTSDPVTNAHLVCRLLLEKKKKHN